METAPRTESTFVAGSLPARATAAADDPSCLMAMGSADRLARLVEELAAACDRGGESRFEAPGFAAAAPHTTARSRTGNPGSRRRASRRPTHRTAHPGHGSGEGPRSGAGQRGSPWESEITAVANAHTVLPPARQAPSLSPAVGEMLGEYRLLASLGRGRAGRRLPGRSARPGQSARRPEGHPPRRT